MKILILPFILVCVACQGTKPQGKPEQQTSKPTVTEIRLQIDPFYESGKHPDITLRGEEAKEIAAILNAAPKSEWASPPPMAMVSPTPGLCILKCANWNRPYYILQDCRVTGIDLRLESRQRLYQILSRHTRHFTKP